MSTIQTRNKMADTIHRNQFYFVANAQLFNSSEQTEVSPMSTTAVNIAAAFHIFVPISGLYAGSNFCQSQLWVKTLSKILEDNNNIIMSYLMTFFNYYNHA